MSRQYGCIAFTDDVALEQEEYGSAEFFRRVAHRGDRDTGGDELGPHEREFLESRDSFYLATVSETGWPYVQFRGGPAGFLQVQSPHTIAWADFRGNLQHVSTGNLRGNDRVAIIALDYARRRRLKIFGRARVVKLDDDPDAVQAIRQPNDDSVVERGVFVTVSAFDWNCPQHITPRFTRSEVSHVVDSLQQRVRELEHENASLRKPTT